MEIVRYPDRNSWNDLVSRPAFKASMLDDVVEGIIESVKVGGDDQVRACTLQFDKADIDNIAIEIPTEIDLSPKLKSAIDVAATNIRKFHQSQVVKTDKIETTPGVFCWQKSIAIESVGLYVPGGTAPLFSTVLMLAIPASVANCKEIVLATPPNSDGDIDPAILYAAKVAGVDKIYRMGGVQAIAAMAYGTESVPKVDKIFGPGNQYVTAAKRAVSRSECAIDMPAGPSEVAVIADQSADPAFIAADLLSQAEHGMDSQAVLFCTSEKVFNQVESEIEKQLEGLSRREFAAKSISNSRLILLDSIEDAIAISNIYAPEHLIILMDNPEIVVEGVVNAGSVFIGHYTPESAGDYASGTNHTLPTDGWAKSYSGVNMDAFVKKVTFQSITKDGIKRLGPHIEVMAEAELLTAHKNAATLRIELAKNS